MNCAGSACEGGWLTGRALRLVLAALAALAALAVIPGVAVSQSSACSARHPMVDQVRILGTHAVPRSVLADMIASDASGRFRRWFGWNVGPLYCLDSVEVARDAQRIREEYETHGYPGTVVKASVTRRGTGRAQVAFAITESAPIRIEAATFDSLPGDVANVSGLQKLLRNAPLDSALVIGVRDSIQNLIRAAGHALAAPPAEPVVVVDSARRRATVRYAFFPGPIVNVGEITVKITPVGGKPAIDSSDVRKLLRVKPGDRYSPRQIAASQRDLYATELYRAIRIDSAAYDSVRNVLPLHVALAEGSRRHLRIGGGWGTLDCFRTQLRFVEQNAFSSGHRFEFNGRLSKIGLVAPFTGLSSLCTSGLRDDPFSQRLNYYAGATVNLRGVLGAKLRPSLTVYSERRSEFAVYEQSTDVGLVASLSRELATRLTATLQYQFVNARTIADGAVSCERFGFCRLEDLASFRLSSPIHTLSAVVAKNPLSPVDDPVKGYRWQLEARQGYTIIARTLPMDFTRLSAEAAAYVPAGSLVTVALRAQLGFVRAPSDVSTLLPPSERFYSGGQNSVRGYNQNVLGPGSYIVGSYVEKMLADSTVVGEAKPDASYRPAPSGGNAMWLANIELRLRRGFPSDALRWVVFVDAGRVWNTNDVFSSLNADARITPGFGVRLATPLGPFRMDVGYNAYPPDAGPAFFVQPADKKTGAPGRAICVSPGTNDPLVLPPGGRGSLLCPATFTPSKRTGLLPRLAFHFSIGQAF